MEKEEKKWCRISVRIESEELDPAAISARMGENPDFGGEAGQHIGGIPTRAKYATNLWGWRCPLSSALPPEELFEATLQWIETRRDQWLQMLSSSDAKADLFVGYGSGNGQGGFSLSPEMLQRMADLRLELALDLYPPESE